MCGRKTLTKGKIRILEELSADDWDEMYDFEPSYNIAPTQISPILIDNGKKAIVPMRWGLIPSWTKDMKMAARMINARSETLQEKPSFRNLIPRQRCIVITDGYYEWKKSGASRIPHYIRRPDHSLICMAGLWDRWHSPDGSIIQSYTVITTSPAESIQHIHDRMPVILDADDYPIWLHCRTQPVSQALDLLTPYRGDLEAYPVSTYVNSPVNNDAQCIQKI